MLAFVLTLGLLVGGWFVLRDSSVVQVRHVEIRGVAGSQAVAIRGALENAAHDMTTLHVRTGQLRAAVAPFPIVEGVSADAGFPHTLRITVREHVPVAAVSVGGRRIPIAADGTVLRGSSAADVPALAVRVPPAGGHVADPRTAALVRLLAAAPPALRGRLARAYVGPNGLSVRTDVGLVLWFGSSQRLPAKWAAAVAVLADPSSEGATHLDLRVPERPAAGGLEQIATQEPAGTTTVPVTP